MDNQTQKHYQPQSAIDHYDSDYNYPDGYYEFHILRDLGYFMVEQMITNKNLMEFGNFMNEIEEMLWSEDYYRLGPAWEYFEIANKFDNIYFTLHTMWESAMIILTNI